MNLRDKIASSLTSWEYVISIMGYPSKFEDIEEAINRAQSEGYDNTVEEFIQSCEEFTKLYLSMIQYSSNMSISKKFSKVFMICSQSIKLYTSRKESSQYSNESKKSLENINWDDIYYES